jgi:beta-phosphoglucomutase
MSSLVEHLQACIFDFDGVLVDSEPVHERASRAVLDRFGIAYPPTLFVDMIGQSEALVFNWIKDNLDAGDVPADVLIETKHAMYASLYAEVQPFPDVEPFVRAALRQFGRLGMASSAIRRDINRAIRQFHMEGWFDVIVSGDDTPLHKPNPEPYLMVLHELGVGPQDALVIEDTPSGLTAAVRAGCVTAGLTTSWKADALRAAGADIVAGSLTELGELIGLALVEAV